MEQSFTDILQIRDLIERWVVYRDAMLWDSFRTVWHSDGFMRATWTEGHFEDFIKITNEGVKKGLNIIHNLGGSAVEIKDNRAVSMTKFIILQRAVIDGILCDVTCYARHYDLWEKRNEKWGLVRRETIAEKDRIDPVASGEKLILDQSILNKFPIEYRHLAYLQTRAGYTVNTNCPVHSGGAALDELYKRGEQWLEGVT